MQQGTVTTLMAIAGILVLFVVFGVVLWQTDALVFTGTDPSSKVVAAVLALIGAFLVSVVSILGIVIKHTVDRRTEDRLQAEAQRTAVLQREAENRLKLEAAIGAIQLLATQSGSPSLPIQRAGALIALSSLGQHTLTLALMSELLRQGDLEPSTAAVVLDHAFMSGDGDVQTDAMARLTDSAAQLVTPTGFELPAAVLLRAQELPVHIRRWIPVVVARVLLARSLRDWNSALLAPSAYTLVGTLCLIWEAESHPASKRDAAAILGKVLSSFPSDGTITHPAKTIELTSIRAALKQLEPASVAASTVVKSLEQWGRV
jgi:hypothetical protein